MRAHTGPVDFVLRARVAQKSLQLRRVPCRCAARKPVINANRSENETLKDQVAEKRPFSWAGPRSALKNAAPRKFGRFQTQNAFDVEHVAIKLNERTPKFFLRPLQRIGTCCRSLNILIAVFRHQWN